MTALVTQLFLRTLGSSQTVSQTEWGWGEPSFQTDKPKPGWGWAFSFKPPQACYIKVILPSQRGIPGTGIPGGVGLQS